MQKFFFTRGAYWQAVAQLEVVLNAEPQDAASFNRLGDCYKQLGVEEAAQMCYARAGGNIMKYCVVLRVCETVDAVNQLSRPWGLNKLETILLTLRSLVASLKAAEIEYGIYVVEDGISPKRCAPSWKNGLRKSFQQMSEAFVDPCRKATRLRGIFPTEIGCIFAKMTICTEKYACSI